MRPIHLRFVGASELPKSLSDFDVEQSICGSNDRTASVPRALLRSLCGALGQTETAIASLKTIYARVATLYEHQKWTREFAGITDADDRCVYGLECCTERSS